MLLLLSIQLAVGGLFLGQGDHVAAQVNAVQLALLDQGAVQEVHLGAADEACNEHVARHIVQVLRGIDLLDASSREPRQRRPRGLCSRSRKIRSWPYRRLLSIEQLLNCFLHPYYS